MPRFSIKDLLIGTTLIAIGAMMFVAIFQSMGHSSGLKLPIAWFSGGAFIGAGLFTPFRKPWAGAMVGVLFQFFLVIAFGIVALFTYG